MAGYSGKPLVEKLGLKAGYKFLILNSPPRYKKTLGQIPLNAVWKRSLDAPLDFVQFFTKKKADLESKFVAVVKTITPDGMIWISWPKGTSGVKTDLNETVVREIGLKNGMVDVKVCAVDEVWSGLKFVFRLKDRPT
jgi:hypothetical protein